MSPQRRRSNRGRQSGDGRSARNNQGNSGNKGRGKARRNQRARPARTSVDAFWGSPDAPGGPQGPDGQAPTVERIRPTTDPGALPRSLGEPPLTPDTAASHHLAVVYEEAVRAATALAVANGLLDDPDADLGPPIHDPD